RVALTSSGLVDLAAPRAGGRTAVGTAAGEETGALVDHAGAAPVDACWADVHASDTRPAEYPVRAVHRIGRVVVSILATRPCHATAGHIVYRHGRNEHPEGDHEDSSASRHSHHHPSKKGPSNQS